MTNPHSSVTRKPGPQDLETLFSLHQSELSDGIAVLVGSNDRVQGVISQLEDTCKTIEVSQVTPKELGLQLLGVCNFLNAPVEIPILPLVLS